MLLRLIASLGHAGRASHAALPGRASHAALPGRANDAALPADTLKGAIRLQFAAWRLSLPLAHRPDENHDRKIA
ncbi:hypothetical protein FJ970_13870 [Mesorhizobium sp. B2-1-8]|uniref:hypothetical protein n=1 Tax=Mesorhizobium sp. B2-1-8 TaxID=2589967 RepID=UPI001D0F92AA|nr:hypothetical protein [Mesorhizobium sp. B2-1-8]UCI21973.1 hypothetical protein FJ970_13870 [Mesorhizobium sp. B2-1-8]